MQEERLSKFVTAVRETTFALVEDDRLPTSQQELLRTCLQRFFDLSDPNDWAQPLGLLYATYRGFGTETTRKAHLIGAFCVCYFTSGDLFDDIQDDDLAGKALEDVGAPIAINTALALLLIGLRALNEGAQLETEPERRAGYFDILNRASLIAIGAQHLDLTGLGASPTLDAVLAMNRGKVACIALVAECGALLGGADPAQAARFRDFGSDFAGLVQIVDDVRDLFGKDESPDLLAGKVTYPIACFQSIASDEQKAEFTRLRGGLPGTFEAIRELLCAAGALDASAAAAEEVRQAMHSCLMALPAPRAEHRLLLSMVDTLASTLYAPEPIPESAPLFMPTGGLHDDLRAARAAFLDRLDAHGVLPVPELQPWHAPLYLFDPTSSTIRYPDLDELREEVVGQLTDLLELAAPSIEPAMQGSMPLLLAHEMFHAWRHAAGRLSADAWHEEFVANRLAMAYALRFEPQAAQATLVMSQLVLAHVAAEDGEDALLARASLQGEASDYALSFRAAARIHARMLIDAAQSCDFDADRASWLTPSPISAAESVDAEPLAAE